YMYPEIGEATLAILRHMGMNVLIPHDQGCCGLPALSSGDAATVEELSGRNLLAFGKREPDAIITSCASCNIGMGKHFGSLGPKHARLAEKVTDIHVFLQQHGLAEKLAA